MVPMIASPPLSIYRVNLRRSLKASRLTAPLCGGSLYINNQSVGIPISTTEYASTSAPSSMPSCAKVVKPGPAFFAQSPARSSGKKIAARSQCAPKKTFLGSGVGMNPTHPWPSTSEPRSLKHPLQGTASMATAGTISTTPEPRRKPPGLGIGERLKAWHHTPCWMN